MTAPKLRQRLQRVADKRSTWARRHKQLAAGFAADLGGKLSAIDRSLIDHAATVAVECEQIKAAQLNDQMVNLDDLVRLSNSLTRMRIELGKRAEAKTDPRSMTFAERMKAREERIKAEAAPEGSNDDDFDF
jgi:hypothetical protein